MLAEIDNNHTSLEAQRITTSFITLRVSKSYHQEPVISNLISKHGLTVNITAAILGENAKDDGWFSLELRGKNHQIQSGLAYLQELDLEIWSKSHIDEENW